MNKIYALKLELENIHGESISDSMWDYLQQKGLVQDVVDGKINLNDLEDFLDDFLLLLLPPVIFLVPVTFNSFRLF